MGAIREIEWEPCLLVPDPFPELERRFQRETGRPGRIMRFFGDCPWLADTMVRFTVQLNTHVHLDPDLVDQAGLVVSQDNSCRFCFGMQRAFLRMIGMNEARISRLEQDHLTGEFTQRERAALDFARRISRSRPMATASDFEVLRGAGFSKHEVAELSAMTALHLFFNRISTLSALPPEPMERFPDRWWIRLSQPLMAVMFRRMRRYATSTRLTPVERTGPGAMLVNSLDGLPLAREFRVVLNGMWSSSTLSSRAVSLIFAVVSRALDSTRCEEEARSRLRIDGLSDDDIDYILAHLSSPLLTQTEKVLVPFARETVWYQPAQIQRRCAEVQKEFLHFIGVVSLVNALCRIGFISDIEG